MVILLNRDSVLLECCRIARAKISRVLVLHPSSVEVSLRLTVGQKPALDFKVLDPQALAEIDRSLLSEFYKDVSRQFRLEASRRLAGLRSRWGVTQDRNTSSRDDRARLASRASGTHSASGLPRA